MNEIVIGDHTYRIGKLNAMQQWHVARRMMPVVMAMGSGVISAMNTPDEAAGDMLLDAFGPVADALAKMSDADTEYVINTCLSVCQRKQSEQYAPVRSSGGLMFTDIDMQVMMKLAMAVIKEHRLADFTSVLPIAPP